MKRFIIIIVLYCLILCNNRSIFAETENDNHFEIPTDNYYGRIIDKYYSNNTDKDKILCPLDMPENDFVKNEGPYILTGTLGSFAGDFSGSGCSPDFGDACSECSPDFGDACSDILFTPDYDRPYYNPYYEPRYDPYYQPIYEPSSSYADSDIQKNSIGLYYTYVSTGIKAISGVFVFRNIENEVGMGLRVSYDYFTEKLPGGYDTLSLTSGMLLFYLGQENNLTPVLGLGMIGVGANFIYGGTMGLEVKYTDKNLTRTIINCTLGSSEESLLTDITLGQEIDIGGVSLFIAYRILKSKSADISGTKVGTKFRF